MFYPFLAKKYQQLLKTYIIAAIILCLFNYNLQGSAAVGYQDRQHVNHVMQEGSWVSICWWRSKKIDSGVPSPIDVRVFFFFFFFERDRRTIIIGSYLPTFRLWHGSLIFVHISLKVIINFTQTHTKHKGT